MYAYRYDKHTLQLLEQMPCRFSCSFYGANWYPTLRIQESFYGIYQKTLYQIKDFNIARVSDAPNVQGFGYATVENDIIAYELSSNSFSIFNTSE